MPTLSEELSWRGLFNQTTFDDIKELDASPKKVYLGIDPTADSIHVGHLAVLMLMRHLLEHGWEIVLLVGGATGMIGDPSGKNEERTMLSLEAIAHNKKSIAAQVSKLFEGKPFTMVDNYDWLSKLGLLEFLRDVGKHFGMSTLVQRDYIAQRIGAEGRGISYTEFSYTLLQGYDFWHLFKTKGIEVQAGGSDQWGNMLSGVDFIRKKEGRVVHVISAPIIINKATGKKFGKSEQGAVWLDANKTSPFQFYQFWLNSDDQSVVDYLKYFTMLDTQAIDSINLEMSSAPHTRVAQKRLAYEVTAMVHGSEKAQTIQRISEILFSNAPISDFQPVDLQILEREVPICVSDHQATLTDLLVQLHLAASKSEARRFIADGAVSVNGVKHTSEDIKQVETVHGYIIVKRGKNNIGLIKMKV